MKKLLLAIFALPMVVFGQGLETFDNATSLPTGTSYGDGNFIGNNGIQWNYVHCQAAGTYPIDGEGILLRRANEPSSLSATISGGIGNLSVDTRKGYAGNAQRRLELVINGVVHTQFEPVYPSGETPEVVPFVVNGINVEGTVDIEFRLYGSAGNQHIVLDNISWTAYSASCNITNANLSALICNDNGTASDPVDDYITFTLDPAGTLIGTDYTVSVSSGTITPATGTYGAATSFQLQDGSAGAGNVVVTITDADEATCTLDVTITDPGSCSSVNPVITVTPSSLTGFDHVVGTPSASQTFTVSGIALSDDLIVTAPVGFELSLDNVLFGLSVSSTPVSGNVPPTTVYIRGNSPVYGAFSGDIIASSTGADNDTVTVSGFANDYLPYTIDQINGVDANGVGDSLNVLVRLHGVLHCMDFRANAGYNFIIIDETGEGLYVFSTSDVSGYTNPVAGDSLEIKGRIEQFNGLLQVVPVEVNVLATGVDTNAPTIVTVLDETTESQYITLENVTLVTPIATFPTANTNLDVTDGTSTFQIRILTSTDLAGAPAPQGPFNVTGIGSQFDSSIPYTSGYQLIPCGTDAIEIACTGTNLPDTNVDFAIGGTTITAVATGASYQWIDCADNSHIPGATGQSYEATAPGEYAVIVDNGTCADTSVCVTVNDLSVSGIDFGKSIVAYPNPVDEQLTIKNYSSMEIVFTVVDINGKVVAENTTVGTAAVVNTSAWNKGVYFVHFNGKNGESHTLKVVK